MVTAYLYLLPIKSLTRLGCVQWKKNKHHDLQSDPIAELVYTLVSHSNDSIPKRALEGNHVFSGDGEWVRCGAKRSINRFTWHPVHLLVVSVPDLALAYIWAKDYNWKLEFICSRILKNSRKNEEVCKREDEFDLVLKLEKAHRAKEPDVNEDEEVDIVTEDNSSSCLLINSGSSLTSRTSVLASIILKLGDSNQSGSPHSKRLNRMGKPLTMNPVLLKVPIHNSSFGLKSCNRNSACRKIQVQKMFEKKKEALLRRLLELQLKRLTTTSEENILSLPLLRNSVRPCSRLASIINSYHLFSFDSECIGECSGATEILLGIDSCGTST
nr:protein RBL [Ipomoea batatas]